MTDLVASGASMATDGASPSRVLHDFGDGPVLAASRCPDCGEVRYPARDLCVHDQAEMVLVPVARQGRLYVAVYVARPPFGFDEPFWVGYVDMPEGIRVFAALDGDGEEIMPGTSVRYDVRVVRTEPHRVLGPVFSPVRAEESTNAS